MSTLEEIDALANLEERIQRAIQLVAKLRKEKEAAEAAAAEAKAESARLADELKSLHSERRQVRSRIEKLLGQIDQMSAG